VENTGETVKRLIIDRTITEAKGLLVSGNYLIKEITYSLGYSNPAYFSRIFKKKTNLTPEDNYNL
jgi:AraC family transcriptional activator of pobA